MGRGAVALGAILIVAGGGALGYAFTRKATGGMKPEQTTAMTEALVRLDGDLKSERGKVKERATSLATQLPVRSAVGGDKDTAKDALERGELNWQPTGSEIDEMGSIIDGKRVTFLVQPAGKAPVDHAGKAESRIKLVGTDVMLLEVVTVEPPPVVTEGVPQGRPGYIAVSRTVSIKDALDRLAAAKIDGRFELMGDVVPIGNDVAADVKSEARPLPSMPEAKIVVAIPEIKAQLPIAIVGAGGGAAGLGLIVMIIGVMMGSSAKKEARKAAQTQPGMGPANRPSFRSIETKPSDSITPATHGGFGSGEASIAAPADIGPGTMIGRWEVIRRLGSGGMADVYLSRAKGEAGFEKLVAVKVMHPHLARNARAVEHFLDEARLAARIAHPNVVAIQDLGKIGNDFVIVMEYVEGIDLERLLASARAGQRPVPINVGLGILCRVCDGLTAAHTALAPDGTPLSVIHRDVKSANVLVSRQGGVKVVDFGIAKAATQTHMTVQGETKGTPSMMAPEQRVGEKVDVRADVYSTGAVGFEILSGHAVNLDLAALAHLGVENWPHLPPPSQLRPDLPFELDRILLGAMSFDREKRPPNCAALESTVEEVMKRYGLTCTDKDIGRWVDAEIRIVAPEFQTVSTGVSAPTSG